MWEKIKTFLKRPEIAGSIAIIIAGVVAEAYPPLGNVLTREFIMGLLLAILGGGAAARYFLGK
jgi:hypothetical protein